MRRRTTAASVALVLSVGVAPSVLATPPAWEIRDVPPVSAEAWIVYDADADVVLASRDAIEERPMASVTKIMTALVAVRNAELDEVVTISEDAAAVGEAEIDLIPGEEWTLRELLTAIMVRSANDAAVAIAEHVGGSVAGFADMMNETAAELGLTHTRFTNPHGLDEPDHYTSARDLLTLGVVAYGEPVIAALAETKVVKFRSDPEGRPRRAVSTNRLLGAYPGVVGLKTGFTNLAGRVLVSAAVRGDRTVFAVVMGSEDHFADSRALLEWAFTTQGVGERLLAGLAEEQGGGGEVMPLRLRADLRDRVAALEPLPDGAELATPAGTTPGYERVRAWLGSRLPVVLGGDR